MLVRVNLELEGFTVVEAATLEEADAALAASGRTSFYSTSISKAGRHSASSRGLRSEGVPVALVTGSVDVDEYRDAADAVLSKPFAPQALVAIARRLARVDA